ncbi:MAG TPA: cytochrome c oxidase assembly protein, partial [Usitatibacter sp.]|nr:cytochrome c oxidase assembly protein [Usitatibacter sp.]
HVQGAAASFEPWAVVCLALSATLYAIGVRRLWRRAGGSRGIPAADVARFAAGWLVLCVALLPPLDAMSDRSFATHMVQHELLMVVAAPLLVLARPLEAWTWALPAPWRPALGAVARSRGLRAAWRWCTAPVGAWILHAVALWAWHIPVLFEAALASEAVHTLQHASFFATALLFWWSVFERARRNSGGASFASLFTTMAHSSALGALLTLAPDPWYPSYLEGKAFGLTALEDQQLGGLIMWGPASLAYLAAALLIAYRWLSPPRRIAGSRAASSP